MSAPELLSPSYEELAGLVVGLASELGRAQARIAELEARLTAQRQAEQDLLAQQARRPVKLTDDELAWLHRAGADVRAVFDAPTTSFRERKQLLRAILSEVVVTVDTQVHTAALRLIWQGGSVTELTMAMTKAGGHFKTTDEDTVALLRRLALDYDDTTIALILSRQRRRTGTGLSFTKSRVTSLRVSRGISAYQPATDTVTPKDGCGRGHRRPSPTPARRRQSHDLPVAGRWIPYRRAAHRRSSLADPDRPGRPGPDRPRRPRGLGRPRGRRQGPRSRPPNRVAQGPGL